MVIAQGTPIRLTSFSCALWDLKYLLFLCTRTTLIVVIGSSSQGENGWLYSNDYQPL